MIEPAPKPPEPDPHFSKLIVGGHIFECLPHVAKEAKKMLDKGTHRPDIIIRLSVLFYEMGKKEIVTLFTRADCIQGVIE